MLEQYFEEWEGYKKQENGERAVKYCLPSLTQSVQAVAASSDAALDLTCLQPVVVHEGTHRTQPLLFELLDILCSGERDEMCLSSIRYPQMSPLGSRE